MIETKLVVQNPHGLHARPATEFVQVAQTFQAAITLEKDGKSGNGKSLIGVMSLGIGQGAEITLLADGADEVAAVQALRELVEPNQT